jgi:hypothetical protein
MLSKILSHAISGVSTTIISVGDKYISSSNIIDKLFELDFSSSPNYIKCTYRYDE